MKERWTTRQMMVVVAVAAVLMANVKVGYKRFGRVKEVYIQAFRQRLGVDWGLKVKGGYLTFWIPAAKHNRPGYQCCPPAGAYEMEP
jgi:hypothetical protein